ncbi:type IIL restriction-modification enzyme MmeI [Lacticaseibacillus rhamnosus]
MPATLRKAHMRNDKFVDSIYGLSGPSEEDRVAKLVGLY